MNKDERKWIHPRALAVLDETFRHECLAGRSYKEIKPSSSLPNAHCLAKCGIAELCEAESKWDDAGCPLLSDKAKALLAAVEKEMKKCNECGDHETCPLDADCSLEPIRDAWKGKKS